MFLFVAYQVPVVVLLVLFVMLVRPLGRALPHSVKYIVILCCVCCVQHIQLLELYTRTDCKASMIWSLIVPNLIAKQSSHAVSICQSEQNKQSLASELSQHLGHKSHKKLTQCKSAVSYFYCLKVQVQGFSRVLQANLKPVLSCTFKSTYQMFS